jgi:hypothetical protein
MLVGETVDADEETVYTQWVPYTRRVKRQGAADDLLTYVISNGTNVKIGRTGNLEKRIRDLRADQPLTVLLTFPGDVEAGLHMLCDDWWVRGEWFSNGCVDLLNELASNPALLAQKIQSAREERMIGVRGRWPSPTRNAKTARLSQRIDPVLKSKIAAEAERRHLDDTAIVTIALNEYFERQAANPAEPTPVRLTKNHPPRPMFTTPA